MNYQPSKNEKIILHTLQHGNALDEGSALSARELSERAAAAGLSEHTAFEMALMNLIDHDLVEYEMDENAQASSFWLIEV